MARKDFEQELNDLRLAAMKRVHSRGRLVRMKTGDETKEAIKVHSVQWYFHTVGFVNALRYVYERCPYLDARAELSESLYEEETGEITGTMSHLDLYYQWSNALGISPDKLKSAYIFPEMAAVVHWYHYAAMQLDPLEGLAVLTFAAEGNNASFGGYQGASGVMRDALKTHYGFDDDAVLFWHVHDYADQEHAEVGARTLAKYARTKEQKDRLRAVLHTTYDILGGTRKFENYKLKDCWKRPATQFYS